MKNAKKTVPLWKVLVKTFPVIFQREHAGATILCLVLNAVHSTAWAVGTFVTQTFFDAVQAAVGGTGPAAVAYGMLAANGALMVAQQLLNTTANFNGNMIFEKFKGLMLAHLHKKAVRVDPVAFESAGTLDDLEKARAGSESALNITFNIIATFAFYGVYFGIIGAYLFSLAPVLALALPIIFVPSFLTVIARSKISAKLEDVAAPARRKMEANEKAIGDRQFFKETRTLGAYAYFRRQYLETLALFNRENWRADRKSNLIELGLKAITALGYFGVLAILFSLLIGGTISLGAFAAVLSSLGMMIGIMDEMIARNMSQIAGDVGKASNFVRFLELGERMGTARPQGEASIELRGAAFRYPGAEKDALTGVDLSIKAGETIAVVGENGAGKTTLVRLLTGLYLPTSGSVKLRGEETRDIEPGTLFASTSAVMQNFQRYKMTLAKNVRLGDTDAGDGIEASLEKADLALSEAFPQGEDTMLSREFDGVDLSGGQWQRVALARGFYRAHDMIVLDEPTAAIDPLEETRLYQKFAELSRGKTAVIVTHRLGSARIADRIVVMDAGAVDSIGTHDELIRQNGKYARMFNAQAQWYA